MRNLVLTGFMGVGKSSVGSAAARLLGRELVDTDRELASRLGAPVAEVLRERGEAALREAEAELCQELRGRDGLVIATGGGTLLDPASRAALGERGVIVCLCCAVDELLERFARDGADRPLLAAASHEGLAGQRAAVERLLAARRESYEAIPWQLDTTSATVEQTTRRAAALAATETLEARAGEARPYPVHLGHGLLDQLGSALRAAGVCSGSARVAVVSNPVVAPLYAARAEAALSAAGYRPFECLIPDGEREKTLATVERLYGALLDGELDRGDLVVSLGGGVTGDVAGFVAATYLRGVAFVNVPTSLLAMVDASVGGKTGVDLPAGKNLVGAFHQPRLVLIDPALLKTLPPAHLRAGLAEVIKHGVLGDPGLLDDLERGSDRLERLSGAEAATLIARALRVKLAVVAEDPGERDRRAVLNLGHTVGHALERVGGYEALLHGQAVAIGLCAAARIARARGLADDALVARIEALLERWGLPRRLDPPGTGAADVLAAMAHDKKRRGGAIRWVLPRAAGDVVLDADVPSDVVRAALVAIGAQPAKEE